MGKLFRNTFFIRIVAFIMAMHFINLSVDVQFDDRFLQTSPINEQESITEFFMEQLLDIEDAFPEQDCSDSLENKAKKALSQFYFETFPYLYVPKKRSGGFTPQCFTIMVSQSLNVHFKLNTPPPEHFI